MPSKTRSISEKSLEAGLGSLRGCLVEGDAEQRSRERRIRRRALVISILAQTAVLAALVLVPLFGKTERLAAKDFVPIPPYGHHVTHARGDRRTTNSHPTNPTNPSSIRMRAVPSRLHPGSPILSATTSMPTPSEIRKTRAPSALGVFPVTKTPARVRLNRLLIRRRDHASSR